ncbi:MAG: amidohydrolase family protein [Bacilli bacterium]|nr:amidohydrolase family protein [Bacilli bacterium]
MKILLKNAHIIKMDDSPMLNGDILINGNKIEKIASNIDGVVDNVIDCKGNILLPGFKNAHSHTGMTFLRGGGKDLPLQEWLFTYCFPREDKLTPSDVYYATKVGIVEYIQAGITAALDMYFFPIEIGRASEELGFRMVLQGMYNSYTNKKELIRLYKEYNSKKSSLVTYQIGVHAEYTLGEDAKKNTLEVINELKIPFYTHISETEKEVKECYERHGVSPVKYFDDLGAYKYGGAGYHCIFFSDDDCKIFKEKNVSIITCPGSNKYLNDGLCPVQKYFDMGFDVSIGTDGPASNYDLNMFLEMRLIRENNPNIPCYDILKMATRNSALAMKLNNCDILAEGKLADIIMLDSNLISDKIDIAQSIVENGMKTSVKMTMIDGKILYMEGKFFFGEEISKMYENCEKVKERINGEILC